MSVGLALEFAPIRVNTVSPGPVDTPMWDRYGAEQKKKFLEGAASHVPLKRVAQPEEIARNRAVLHDQPLRHRHRGAARRWLKPGVTRSGD